MMLRASFFFQIKKGLAFVVWAQRGNKENKSA